MPRSVSICLIAVTAVLSGCSGFGIEPDPFGDEIPMTRLRAEPYSFTFFSGLKEPDRLVIRDEAAWQSVWTQIHAGRTPTPALPAIDFSRQMVVVAAMGTRTSGGYGILFESAHEDAPGGIVLRVLSTSPGKGCVSPAVLTDPVDIAVVAMHPGPVRFAERSVTRNCD